MIEGTTVQLPTLASTSVSTTVSVPDGGTILLGGVKRLSEQRNERGIPILSKIPYVSRLFRNVAVGRTASSLMLMVTPRIIIQEEEELAQTGFDRTAKHANRLLKNSQPRVSTLPRVVHSRFFVIVLVLPNRFFSQRANHDLLDHDEVSYRCVCIRRCRTRCLLGCDRQDRCPTIQLHAPHRGSRDQQTAQRLLRQLSEMNVVVTAVFGGFEGESYADIPTVGRTVGLVPIESRASRVHEMLEISDFARYLGCDTVALHIGVIPMIHKTLSDKS